MSANSSVHFAIDHDISTTYGWLSSSGDDIDLLNGT